MQLGTSPLSDVLNLGECVKNSRQSTPSLSEELNQGRRVGNRTKHPALHLDHLDRVLMVRPVGLAAAICQQQTFEPAIIGLAHCGMNAHIGGDAGKNEV